jgi:hypothetical protein
MAATDRLFLADIQEIRQDFDSIDHETLWQLKGGQYIKPISTLL